MTDPFIEIQKDIRAAKAQDYDSDSAYEAHVRADFLADAVDALCQIVRELYDAEEARKA